MPPQSTEIGRLVFEFVTPGVEYHAALVSGRARPTTPLHTHDFYEIFYVLEGTARHTINGVTSVLSPGDLMLIRPDDCHAIQARGRGTLLFINVAFHAEPWQQFCLLAGLTEPAFLDAAAAPAPEAHVPQSHRAECASIFERVLQKYQQPFPQRPLRQDLCRFWSAVLDFLIPEGRKTDEPYGEYPAWLARACQAMHEDENLQGGLVRFVEIGGVSRVHLARTLKACGSQTPTDFVNDLRLQRAAMLLATTPTDIIDIAIDCGFENLSYFYRLFRRRYGRSPRAWRLEARRMVIPPS